jgi:predicted CXXCH cytochrome family protein
VSRLRALVLLFAAAVTAQEAEVQIFSPAHESVVGGEVRIVAAGKGKLLLDGQPIEVKSPADGVLHASAKVAAGAHELSIEGGPSVRFHSGAGAPAGWKPFRVHPPGGAACETCHAVKNGAWTFARASLIGVCFACHDREKFPKTHTHEPGIIPDCQLCHSPHGSTAAFHLKMNKETACKQCHN